MGVHFDTLTSEPNETKLETIEKCECEYKFYLHVCCGFWRAYGNCFFVYRLRGLSSHDSRI